MPLKHGIQIIGLLEFGTSTLVQYGMLYAKGEKIIQT